MNFRSPMPLYLVALCTLYISERTLEETARYVVTGLGTAMLLTAVLMGVLRWSRASNERKTAYGWPLVEYGLGFLAMLIYAAQSDFIDIIPSGKADVIASVFWPGLLLLTVPPLVAQELALLSMHHAPQPEVWRLRFASRSARIVALGIITFAGANYAANRWNKKVDLTYFQTSSSGTANKKLVENLTKPLKFMLFFPAGNDVLQAAQTFYEDLAASSDMATVEIFDQAMEPSTARRHKVRGNGYVVIATESQDQKLRLGLDVEDARSPLRRLDGETRKMLLKVLRPTRTAYFTTGHLERDYSPPVGEERLRMSDLRMLLEGLGFVVKRLGVAEGLGSKIPDDASVVFITSPLEPFLPIELTAIQEYIDRGGRLFVMVDPDYGSTAKEILEMLGLEVTESLAATDNQKYLFRLPNERATPYNLATTRTHPHDSVQNIQKAGGRLGVLFKGTGALQKLGNKPNMNITFTLKTMGKSWVDVDSNGEFTEGTEVRGMHDLAAAVEIPTPKKDTNGAPDGDGEKTKEPSAPDGDAEKKNMRAIVVADTDVTSNMLLKNMGNAYFMVDSVQWLAGEEESIGTVVDEEDVPIVHRRDKDLVWFYGSSFFIPAAVLFGGLFYTRKARKKGSA